MCVCYPGLLQCSHGAGAVLKDADSFSGRYFSSEKGQLSQEGDMLSTCCVRSNGVLKALMAEPWVCRSQVRGCFCCL